MDLLLLLLLAMILLFDLLIRSAVRYRQRAMLSPVLWLTAPWVFSLTLLCLPIFEHREIIQAEHVIFIFVAHIAFALGSWIVAFGSNPGLINEGGKISQKQVVFFAVLGGLGTLAAFVDSVSTTGVGFFERLTPEGMARARAANFMIQTGGLASGPFNLLTGLVAFGYLCIACYMLRASGLQASAQRITKIAFWLSIVFISINAIFVSVGRMQLVLLGLVLYAVYLMRVPQNKPVQSKWRDNFGLTFSSISKILVSAIAVVVLGVAGSIFGQARSGGDTSPDELLNASHRVKLNPVVADLTKDSEGLRFGLFTLSYFTVPIPTLIFYLDVPEYRYPGPFLGQYNFPPIMGRIVKRVYGDGYAPWTDLRASVFSELQRQGYSSNVWSTLLRDLSVDFTKNGVFPFMFVFGVLVSYLVTRATKTSNPLIATTASALLVVCGFSIFHSLFYIEAIVGLIFIPAAVYIIGAAWLGMKR
jgi:hypothetical protein